MAEESDIDSAIEVEESSESSESLERVGSPEGLSNHWHPYKLCCIIALNSHVNHTLSRKGSD
jgi:hypothetical protein